MQVTREADYAIRCVLYLASKPGTAAPVGEIEKSMDVPRQFAAKILQKLSKAGIVKSTRGASGGYILARAPKDISLLEVYEASIKQPLALNICVADKKSCDRSNKCPVHPIWTDLTEELAKKMRSWSFAKLLGKQRKNIKGKRRGN